MQQVTLSVAKNKLLDTPIRNILGMNNSPRILVKEIYPFDKKLFDDLNLRFVRHHDATIENPSLMLVDIRKIFPLFHLDENDPKNYVFDQTDDYFQSIKDTGIEVEFRIGETIDHTGSNRFTTPPEDVNKWARICRNVLAHYKTGEFNGMKLNVTRVCVWEEPDNPKLFTGNVNDYFEMFSAVYKVLKKDFPDLKIGGPTTSFHANEFLSNFLKLCKENGITPDFISYTVYLRTVEEVVETINQKKEILSNYGFNGVPITLSEWHLAPTTWDMADPEYSKGFDGSHNAAFSTSLLITLNDISRIDAAFYYAFATGSWNITEYKPIYYGLWLFQKLGAECTERLNVDGNINGDIKVLAGKTPLGKTRLLISLVETDSYEFNVKLDTNTVLLRSITTEFNEKDCTDGKTISAENGLFKFKHEGGSGVYLIEY